MWRRGNGGWKFVRAKSILDRVSLSSSLPFSLAAIEKGILSQRCISSLTVLLPADLLPRHLLPTLDLSTVLSTVLLTDLLTVLSTVLLSHQHRIPWFEGERVGVPPPYDLHVFGSRFRSTLLGFACIFFFVCVINLIVIFTRSLLWLLCYISIIGISKIDLGILANFYSFIALIALLCYFFSFVLLIW